MNPQFTVLRLLAAMTCFSIAFGFIRQAGASTNDLRFPVAIFCTLLAVIFLIPPWIRRGPEDEAQQLEIEEESEAGE